MVGVFVLLALVAFLCAVLAAGGKFPLWVSVLLLTLLELLRLLPR
jgi:hypothetical protein